MFRHFFEPLFVFLNVWGASLEISIVDRFEKQAVHSLRFPVLRGQLHKRLTVQDFDSVLSMSFVLVLEGLVSIHCHVDEWFSFSLGAPRLSTAELNCLQLRHSYWLLYDALTPIDFQWLLATERLSATSVAKQSVVVLRSSSVVKC